MSPELLDGFGRLWVVLGPVGISFAIAAAVVWVLWRQAQQWTRIGEEIVKEMRQIGDRVENHDEREERRHSETMRTLRERRRP